MLAAKLAQLRPLLGIMSTAGGLRFLSGWGWCRSYMRMVVETPVERPGPRITGILTNLLNPHP
jgi:hypothetical protein